MLYLMQWHITIIIGSVVFQAHGKGFYLLSKNNIGVLCYVIVRHRIGSFM